MDFSEFVLRISKLLRIELPENMSRYDSIYDELGLDSFQAFELLIIVEGLAEAMVPPVDVPEIFTMDDAFAYYERLRAAELAGS